MQFAMGEDRARKILGHVYLVTDAGEALLCRPNAELGSLEQEVLLRINGRKTRDDLFAEMSHCDAVVLSRTLIGLQDRGLIAQSDTLPAADPSLDFSLSANAPSPPRPEQSQRKDMQDEALRGALQLQQRGYYVNIARRPGAPVTPRSGKRHSILIIEDDPHLARLMRMLLASEGFSTGVAADREAVVLALSLPPLPDLVLLDVVLPDLDGLDLLRRIRAHPKLADIRVLMVTSRASREDVLSGMESGADGYITKPFDLDNLAAGVNTVLGIAKAE